MLQTQKNPIRASPFTSITASTKPCFAKSLPHKDSDSVLSSQIEIRIAKPHELWSEAELHCRAFHPESSIFSFCGQFLRFARIDAVQFNDQLAQRGIGKCAIILAFAPRKILQVAEEGAVERSTERAQLSPIIRTALATVLTPEVLSGLGLKPEDLGLVGAVGLDTFGDLVPPRVLDITRDAALGYLKREGVAYMANLAVDSRARGAGIGEQLVRAAEDLAQSWGCRSVGLHARPSNDAANCLYAKCGFRRLSLEPPWVPIVQDRGFKRCHFWIKRLPGTASQTLAW